MKRALRDPIFVGIALLGLILTLTAALLVRQDNQERATRWLAERAELVALATEDTVDHTLDDLRAVAAFIATAESVTQTTFDEFVTQMDMNDAIIGIGYVAIVDDSAIDSYLEQARADAPAMELQSFDGQGGIGPNPGPRESYYPLRYVHGGPFLDIVIAETPIDSPADVLGFDLGTEPLWFPAFERALASPDPSVSDLLSVGGIFQDKAFGAAHPIVNGDNQIEGVLVAPGLEILLTADLGSSITSRIVWEVENTAPEVETADWPVWVREIEVPGSSWTLSVQPTEAARTSLNSNAYWLVLAIGLTLTTALATAAHQMRLRRHERKRVAQLQRLSSDKDRFLATVSHELRTPLTVVIGLASELAQNGTGFEDVERTELLGMIEEHGQEAGSIVEDLLVAARSDIDKIAVNISSVDLVSEAELALSASSLTGAVITGSCTPAAADASRVRQILRNLLTNAARYGGGSVEIRMAESNGQCTVTIADNGEPIASERELAIFDPYVSAHEGGDEVGSIGLGLFISRKLARLMGGDLRYIHDGSHSLFELSLPRFGSITEPRD